MRNPLPDSIVGLPQQSRRGLALFTADAWEHVCPVVRWIGPAESAGWRVLRGSKWVDGVLQIFPECIQEASLVVIQRDFPRYIEYYQTVIDQAHQLNKPVVYEIDDLLIDLPADHPDMDLYRGSRAAILSAVAQADGVTCPTPELAEQLLRYQPNVYTIPNYLNGRLWSLNNNNGTSVHERQGPIVIGYMGSASHAPDLEMISPVLCSLLDRYGSRLILRLWGISPSGELDQYPNVEWLDIGLVSYSDFATYFSQQECDIYIAPLRDNLFNRCKSAIKYLEYSSSGAPGVYSKLPAYMSVVNQSVNGILASSLEEWEASLTRLIEDSGLRSVIGRNAQETVRRDWMLIDHTKEWTNQVDAILSDSQKRNQYSYSFNLTTKFMIWSQEDRKLVEAIPDLKKRVDDLESENRDLLLHSVEMQKTESSPMWRLFKLVDAIRLKAFPPGSRREKPLRWGVETAFRLKRGALAPVVRKLAPSRFSEIPRVQAGVQINLTDKKPDISPSISVVIEQNPVLPFLDPSRVIEWVALQSIPEIEIVLWDSEKGIARTITGIEHVWTTTNLDDLCSGLSGGYVTFASPDLLEQDRTYLEENLAALVGENLLFTVNVLGPTNWPARHLYRRRLPGSRMLPIFRQVVRKDCLREGYSLDFSPFLNHFGQPIIAGKLINHTTSNPEYQAAYPFNTRLGPVDVNLRGNYILVRKYLEGNLWPEEPIRHAGVQLNKALPTQLDNSSLPTVLMVFPFIAVGGAEEIHLQIIKHLKGQVRFVVVTVDPIDPELGTMTETFAQVTPWVYNMPDFLHPELRFSFLNRIIERFHPISLYIASGAAWIYDVLPELKQHYPALKIIDQVYDFQMGWINRYDSVIASLMDHCIGCNQRICQAYHQHGVPKNRISLIQNGVDLNAFVPADYLPEKVIEIRKKFGLPEQGKIVTFAARIGPQKRPMDFVELARRFSAEPGIIFLMVGDGPLAQAVDEQISQLGLRNIVRQGFYRPITDVLAITDVLVLPSEFEGMPMILVETLAMGKPVVVTDVGNNREILEITGGGVVVSRPGDIGGLTNGIQQMLETPPDPVRLRERIQSHFGIQSVAEKYKDILTGCQSG